MATYTSMRLTRISLALQRVRRKAGIAAQAGPVTPVAAPSAAAVEPQVKAPPKDVWERVRNGYTMKPMDTDLVRHWENFYSAKPEYFARMVDRSSHYLYHIIEEVERRKMPTEVALLPMIESAYNPQAYSKAHASGLWQFIPSTGRLYGLRQNWWYDGRRDVIAATNAALDYLEKLYGMFGDWELALASYNWGEGSVGRAVAKNQAQGQPTGYDDIRMPAETKNYVPRLQAIKNILRDPQLVAQMNLPVLPNRPYFESVALYGKHIDLDTAAKLANISVDEVKALNPEHSRPVMKVETINLPKDRVPQFKSNLNAYQESEKPLSRWGSYTVQPGEKPERIASKFNMSLAQLQEANGVSMKSLSKPGQPLLVLKDPAAESAPAAASLTELNENTPVNVAETPDKPAGKSGASASDTKAGKNSNTANAKDDKSTKSDKTAGKSGKPDKSDKSSASGKSDKASTKSGGGKSSSKATSDSKPAATKSTGKSSDKAAASSKSDKKKSK